MSAACRTRRSTFWATRLAGVTRRGRGGPIWAASARKKVRRLCDTSARTRADESRHSGREDVGGPTEPQVAGLGQLLLLGPVSKAYRAVDRLRRERAPSVAVSKHKVPGRGTDTAIPTAASYECGLVRLCKDRTQLPVARKHEHDIRESLSESRMREIRPSGSMSGRWKRSMVRLVRHRQTKGPATDRPRLNHRATSRLYCPNCQAKIKNPCLG